MKRLLFSLGILLLCSSPAFAALKFPSLTGRVVDDAHVLSSATIESLEQQLGDYERGTSNQVVVVTLPSLQGDTIEDYGYQLGRVWKIGQKGKDNGVLLIVVPSEHHVRIEAGYGLEPLLTDAASSVIVQSVILPDFRAGRMQQGIVDGTQAILSILGGKAIPETIIHNGKPGANDVVGFMGTIIFMIFFLILAQRHPYMAAYLLASSTSRFGSSSIGGDWGGSAGGGGFSGGGGNFGGGGSSGSW